jgi:hypothetical protein
VAGGVTRLLSGLDDREDDLAGAAAVALQACVQAERPGAREHGLDRQARRRRAVEPACRFDDRLNGALVGRRGGRDGGVDEPADSTFCVARAYVKRRSSGKGPSSARASRSATPATISAGVRWSTLSTLAATPADAHTASAPAAAGRTRSGSISTVRPAARRADASPRRAALGVGAGQRSGRRVRRCGPRRAHCGETLDGRFRPAGVVESII